MINETNLTKLAFVLAANGGGSGSGSSSGGGGVMVVNVTYDESAEVNILDKTWQEIHDAMQNGATCFIAGSFEGAVTMEPVVTVASPIPPINTSYVVFTASYNGLVDTIAPVSYYASTANDYPTNQSQSANAHI